MAAPSGRCRHLGRSANRCGGQIGMAGATSGLPLPGGCECYKRLQSQACLRDIVANSTSPRAQLLVEAVNQAVQQIGDALELRNNTCGHTLGWRFASPTTGPSPAPCWGVTGKHWQAGYVGRGLQQVAGLRRAGALTAVTARRELPAALDNQRREIRWPEQCRFQTGGYKLRCSKSDSPLRAARYQVRPHGVTPRIARPRLHQSVGKYPPPLSPAAWRRRPVDLVTNKPHRSKAPADLN